MTVTDHGPDEVGGVAMTDRIRATIVVAEGNDFLLGRQGNDVISGLGGNDRIDGQKRQRHNRLLGSGGNGENRRRL
jgi:Ca2+-binding RTX toxin-like protein